MTQMTVRPADRYPALARRYEEIYAEWLAQDAAVAAARADMSGQGDDADHATAASNLTEESLRADELLRQLDDIETAMHRIETEEYGRCERCRAEIPAERLALFPATTLCVTCKARAER